MAKKPKLQAQLKQLQSQHRLITKQQGNTVGTANAQSVKGQARQPSKAKSEQQRKFVVPFSASEDILLIGEGNFSFAAALASLLGSRARITATSFDTRDVVVTKYPEAAAILDDLVETWGCSLLHGVDATALEQCAELRGRTFGKIVFNFPHAGLGIKDQDRNVIANQKLLVDFFASCMAISDVNTEIVLTVKTGGPYELWNVKRLAKEAGMVTRTSFPFYPDPYPGYEHRRTLGFEEGVSAHGNAEIRNARTYIFAVASDEMLAQINEARAASKKRKSKQRSTSESATKKTKRRNEGNDGKDDDE